MKKEPHQLSRSRSARSRSAQLEMTLKVKSWGGARNGAGRPSSGKKGIVAHRGRPRHSAAHPVHVTLRLGEGLPSLRLARIFRVVKAALGAGARALSWFRLLQYSVQGNHLHLIVEASDAEHLSRGMQGLTIRLAKRINAALYRRGKVFPNRFHARALKTPREVRNALAYVLLNHRRHAAERGRAPVRGTIDRCSSGLSFDGWRKGIQPASHEASSLPTPRTWLLRRGWRRRGLLNPDEIPGHRR